MPPTHACKETPWYATVEVYVPPEVTTQAISEVAGAVAAAVDLTRQGWFPGAVQLGYVVGGAIENRWLPVTFQATAMLTAPGFETNTAVAAGAQLVAQMVSIILANLPQAVVELAKLESPHY